MPEEARYSAPVQTDPWAHTASCKSHLVSFPGVQRPLFGVDHPPLSSAFMACSRLKFTVYFHRKATSFFAFHTPLKTICANQTCLMIIARPFHALHTKHYKVYFAVFLSCTEHCCTPATHFPQLYRTLLYTRCPFLSPSATKPNFLLVVALTSSSDGRSE
jgi:hypothetical protein